MHNLWIIYGYGWWWNPTPLKVMFQTTNQIKDGDLPLDLPANWKKMLNERMFAFKMVI